MSTQPNTFLTEDQYLEIESRAEIKSEYFQGQMFAMSGAQRAHNLIGWNLSSQLHRQLESRPCEAYFGDMRLKVRATGLYTYPDGMAVCGEPQFQITRGLDTLLNPSLVVEVLSSSTEAYDRGRKFEHYRSVESIQEYLLIASERMAAELYTRKGDGHWDLVAYSSADDVIELRSIDCRLTLGDLYLKVQFEPVTP